MGWKGCGVVGAVGGDEGLEGLVGLLSVIAILKICFLINIHNKYMVNGPLAPFFENRDVHSIIHRKFGWYS